MAKVLRGAAALKLLPLTNQVRLTSADPAPDAAAGSHKLSRAKGRAAGARLGAQAGVSLGGRLRQSGATGNAGVFLRVVNLRRFQAEVQDVQKGLDDWLRTFFVAFSEDLFTTVIARTPLKTGRARANWKTDVHNSDSSVFAAPGAYPNPIPPGLAVINNASTGNLYTLIFNNVAYVADLDAGSSSQAPLGIVEVSIAETLARSALFLDASNAASRKNA